MKRIDITYEQLKQTINDSPSASDRLKQCLVLLDEMDCVKALNAAETLVTAMRLKVREAGWNE